MAQLHKITCDESDSILNGAIETAIEICQNSKFTYTQECLISMKEKISKGVQLKLIDVNRIKVCLMTDLLGQDYVSKFGYPELGEQIHKTNDYRYMVAKSLDEIDHSLFGQILEANKKSGKYKYVDLNGTSQLLNIDFRSNCIPILKMADGLFNEKRYREAGTISLLSLMNLFEKTNVLLEETLERKILSNSAYPEDIIEEMKRKTIPEFLSVQKTYEKAGKQKSDLEAIRGAIAHADYEIKEESIVFDIGDVCEGANIELTYVKIFEVNNAVQLKYWSLCVLILSHHIGSSILKKMYERTEHTGHHKSTGKVVCL